VRFGGRPLRRPALARQPRPLSLRPVLEFAAPIQVKAVQKRRGVERDRPAWIVLSSRRSRRARGSSMPQAPAARVSSTQTSSSICRARATTPPSGIAPSISTRLMEQRGACSRAGLGSSPGSMRMSSFRSSAAPCSPGTGRTASVRAIEPRCLTWERGPTGKDAFANLGTSAHHTGPLIAGSQGGSRHNPPGPVHPMRRAHTERLRRWRR
jgi:hypothetical protein